MTTAVFDYTLWATRYPELAKNVGTNLAAAYFAEAGAYLDNTDQSPVPNVARRLMLLNMITAHIAALNASECGQNPSPLVGRITSASEGSVSVSTEMPGATASNAFWYQTKYGVAFWEATKSLRTMRYLPGRQPVFDGPGGGVGPYPPGALPWLR